MPLALSQPAPTICSGDTDDAATGTKAVWPLCDLAEGEELSVNYMDDEFLLMPAPERRAKLAARREFRCECPAAPRAGATRVASPAAKAAVPPPAAAPPLSLSFPVQLQRGGSAAAARCRISSSAATVEAITWLRFRSLWFRSLWFRSLRRGPSKAHGRRKLRTGARGLPSAVSAADVLPLHGQTRCSARRPKPPRRSPG